MAKRHMYHEYADLLNQISAEELRQLVDDENAGAIVITPAPNAAYLRIVANGAKAQAFIDGYCRGRYMVPLSPVPDIIRDLSAELTIYNCMMRKKEIALSEEQNRKYKNAVSVLEHIQGGKIKLYDDVDAPPTYATNKTTDDRTFPDEVLEQF